METLDFLSRKGSIVLLGEELTFYLPASKLTQEIKAKLHDYFIDNHNAYTLETIEAHGFWRKTSQSELCIERNAKYVCSFSTAQIGEFIEFLSQMCFLLEEEAIYVKMGYRSWLVLPKEGNDGKSQGNSNSTPPTPLR